MFCCFLIARIKKFENAVSAEFIRTEPSACKMKRAGADADRRSNPEKDYLSEEGRVPGTEWVVFTKDPSRRGNEKAGFENQGNRKGQVRLIIPGQKAFGEKENWARKLLFAFFFLILMLVVGTA